MKDLRDSLRDSSEMGHTLKSDVKDDNVQGFKSRVYSLPNMMLVNLLDVEYLHCKYNKLKYIND